MSALPPRDRLAQVASSLVRRAPAQFGGLLADDRFADDRAALERLGVDGACRQGASATTEREAAWLAEELLARWAAVGDVALDPAAGLAAPEEIEVGDEPRDVEVSVIVDGLDPDWTVEWSGAVRPVGDGRTAVVTIEAAPDTDAGPDPDVAPDAEPERGTVMAAAAEADRSADAAMDAETDRSADAAADAEADRSADAAAGAGAGPDADASAGMRTVQVGARVLGRSAAGRTVLVAERRLTVVPAERPGAES